VNGGGASAGASAMGTSRGSGEEEAGVGAGEPSVNGGASCRAGLCHGDIRGLGQGRSQGWAALGWLLLWLLLLLLPLLVLLPQALHRPWGTAQAGAGGVAPLPHVPPALCPSLPSAPCPLA
jgi:hypothetical protein